MREIFEQAGQAEEGTDPMQKAQAAMKAQLPKRFYDATGVAPAETGYGVLLDGKPVRTPARNPLAVPSSTLAERLAAEFNAQTEVVDPAEMPLLRLVNTALDGVTGNEQAVKEDIQRFASSDMICYRAGDPQGLVDRQSEHWDGVLDWVRARFGAHFALAEGVMHVSQPRAAIGAIGVYLAQIDDPLRLAALHSLTTLSGSALLAIALAEDFIDADALWAAAHVDEDWNIAQWGEDAEAMARRNSREADMRTAATVLAETAQ